MRFLGMPCEGSGFRLAVRFLGMPGEGSGFRLAVHFLGMPGEGSGFRLAVHSALPWHVKSKGQGAGGGGRWGQSLSETQHEPQPIHPLSETQHGRCIQRA